MNSNTYRSAKFDIRILFHYENVHYKEEFEDTKEVIRIRKSKKARQHKGKKEKEQMDKQHIDF
jgi:hypothetical protein